MTRLMTETYEGADQSEGTRTDASWSIDRNDANHPLRGAENLEVIYAGADVDNVTGCQYLNDTTVEAYIVLGLVRFSDLPSDVGDNVRFITIAQDAGGGTSLFNALIANDGGTLKWGINARDNGSFVYTYSAGASPAANTDYKVMFYYKRHATDGIVTLWVDDAQVATWTTIISSRTVNCIAWGACYSDMDGATSIFMDDVVIDTTDLSGWDSGSPDNLNPFYMGSMNGVARINIGEINGVS